MASASGGRQHHRAYPSPRRNQGYGDTEELSTMDPAAVTSRPTGEPRGGRRDYDDSGEVTGAYRDERAAPGREYKPRPKERSRPSRDQPEEPRVRHHGGEPRELDDTRAHREQPEEARRGYRPRAAPRREFRPQREEPEGGGREARYHGGDAAAPGRDYSTQRDEPGRWFKPSGDEPVVSERARVHRPRRQRYRDDDHVTPPQIAEPEDIEGGEWRDQLPPGGPEPYTPRRDDPADGSETSSFVDLEMVEMRHPRGHSRAFRTQFRPDPPDSPQAGNGQQRLYAKRHNARVADYRPVAGAGRGSLGPVQKAVRASAYSTLSVKSWSELDLEVTVLMRDLNKHFKPLFDKHGSEGVQVKKLRDELNSRRSQHLLGSRDSILERLRYADKDGDDYLSYGDFIVMITQDLKQERKVAFRGMLLSTLGGIGVLPIQERDDFLTSHKFCPPPLFIPIITLIQVVIFAVYVADMEDRGYEVTASSGYPFYSPLPYSPKKRWQAWRFITYMFIHDGYLHIVYNVVSQLLFGFPLELVHSWWRTAIIYLTGVAAGSLAHSVVDSYVGLVGASGGVYAILGAHLAAVVTNWKEMNYNLCDQEEFDSRPCCAISRFFVSAPFRLALVALIVVPDTGLAIYRRVALDEDLRIGVTAHVGGFLTGLFLGIPVLKNVNRHAWETGLGWITLIVFLLVCAFAVFFNSFYDERYPVTDWNWSGW